MAVTTTRSIPCWTTRKEVLGEDAIYDLIPDCETVENQNGYIRQFYRNCI